MLYDSLFTTVSGVSLVGRPPDPELVRLVARRLLSAHECAGRAGSRLQAPILGWQGPAAESMRRDVAALADTLGSWAEHAEQLAGTISRVAAELDVEVLRRRQVRLKVLAVLGRLATLPAEVHRDVGVALGLVSSSLDWQGEVLPLAHQLSVRLPQIGGAGWDSALTALRSCVP